MSEQAALIIWAGLMVIGWGLHRIADRLAKVRVEWNPKLDVHTTVHHDPGDTP
ncbi:MAG: hypothetical protein AAF389_14790 [Gemmatimonadota bacterium]